MTNNTINEISKCIFNFLWDGKPEKISRNVIIQEYEDSGLKMIDLESFITSLKASCVKRSMYGQNCNRVRLYNASINHSGGLFIFKCNLHEIITKPNFMKLKYEYVKEILTAWFKCTKREHYSFPFLKQII